MLFAARCKALARCLGLFGRSIAACLPDRAGQRRRSGARTGGPVAAARSDIMSSQGIGIALGSGSARGWSHIGVLGALADAGIEPSIIAGCSIGALVGAAFAAGRLADLERWALSLSWREIAGMLDVRLTGGGLIGGSQVVAALHGFGVEGSIEALPRRFVAIATDLATGREVWLDRGPVADAVRASISLPGIFAPARIDGRWLVDGGLVNPVPASACRAFGANVILAVNLNGDIVGRRAPAADPAPLPVKPETVDRLTAFLPADVRAPAARWILDAVRPGPTNPGYFGVLADSINIMQDRITRSRLAGEPPHVMLVPRLADFGLMEFNRAAEAIAEGRRAVAEALPSIRRLILA
jgi:NTE family protein